MSASSLPVASKLCYFMDNWRILTADQWISEYCSGVSNSLHYCKGAFNNLTLCLLSCKYKEQCRDCICMIYVGCWNKMSMSPWLGFYALPVKITVVHEGGEGMILIGDSPCPDKSTLNMYFCVEKALSLALAMHCKAVSEGQDYFPCIACSIHRAQRKTCGWWRPVINFKALNLWVQLQHFKMEGIHTLKELLSITTG